MSVGKLLKSTGFFKELSEIDIEKICHAGQVENLAPDQILFMEGDAGESFYLLVEGSVKLFKSAMDGREIIIKFIHSGEIFGEVILFEQQTYPVTAIAKETTKVFRIRKDSFTRLLNDKAFRDDFISILMKKQRYLAKRIHYLASFDVEERFFNFLSEKYGKKYSYTITMTKKDIASIIGTIPETFSRLIKRLTKLEIIEWKDNELLIKKENLWNDFQFD